MNCSVDIDFRIIYKYFLSVILVDLRKNEMYFRTL